MAISNIRVGSASFESGTNSDSMVGSVAGMSIAEGDLVLIVAQCEGGTINTPTNFTQWADGSQASGGEFKVFAKLAGASESNYTVTFSTTNGVKSVYVIAATGAFGSTLANILDGAPVVDTAVSQNVPYEAYTPTNSGAAILYFGWARLTAWTSVAPITDYTELLDATSTLGADVSVTSGYRLSAPALSAGSLAVTGGDPAKTKLSIVLAIYEPSTTGAGPLVGGSILKSKLRGLVS